MARLAAKKDRIPKCLVHSPTQEQETAPSKIGLDHLDAQAYMPKGIKHTFMGKYPICGRERSLWRVLIHEKLQGKAQMHRIIHAINHVAFSSAR